jgi:hypothetical protein
MESTEESETEQPFLPTVVEIANDKSSSKRDFSLFPKIRRACWMQFFLCLCVVLVLFFVGFGVGFLAGHKGLAFIDSVPFMVCQYSVLSFLGIQIGGQAYLNRQAGRQAKEDSWIDG